MKGKIIVASALAAMTVDKVLAGMTCAQCESECQAFSSRECEFETQICARVYVYYAAFGQQACAPAECADPRSEEDLAGWARAVMGTVNAGGGGCIMNAEFCSEQSDPACNMCETFLMGPVEGGCDGITWNAADASAAWNAARAEEAKAKAAEEAAAAAAAEAADDTDSESAEGGSSTLSLSLGALATAVVAALN